jgi:hypothetical protein
MPTGNGRSPKLNGRRQPFNRWHEPDDASMRANPQARSRGEGILAVKSVKRVSRPGRRVSATRREFRSLLRPCHREHPNFVKAMFIRRLSLPHPDAQPQFSTESTADPTGHCRSRRVSGPRLCKTGISQLNARDYRLFAFRLRKSGDLRLNSYHEKPAIGGHILVLSQHSLWLSDWLRREDSNFDIASSKSDALARPREAAEPFSAEVRK